MSGQYHSWPMLQLVDKLISSYRQFNISAVSKSSKKSVPKAKVAHGNIKWTLKQYEQIYIIHTKKWRESKFEGREMNIWQYRAGFYSKTHSNHRYKWMYTSMFIIWRKCSTVNIVFYGNHSGNTTGRGKSMLEQNWWLIA